MLDYFSINERKFSFSSINIPEDRSICMETKNWKTAILFVTRRFYSLKLEFGREYKRKKKLNKNLFIFTKNKK